MFEGLNKLEKVAADYRSKMKDEGKIAVVEGAKDLFNKYSDLEAIIWTQYAPHFNDGDACTFSVHECEYKFKEGTITSETEGFSSGYYEDGTVQPGWKNETEIANDLNEFSCSLQSIEDALEMAFGDGQKISLNRDGTVDVTDWDHD